MVSAFEQANVPLFVAYYRRAYPRFLKLKEFLDNGGLGQLSEVRYTLRKPANPNAAGWRHDVRNSGGGLFVDVGSHAFDLLDFLLGPLREVQGVAARAAGAATDAAEDVVSASFLAGDAILGSATWNFRADSDLETLELIGSRGRAILPELMNGVACTVEYNDGTPSTSWEVEPPAPAVQEPLIQTVVDALRTGESGRCASTGASALRTANYLDAILDRFYGGRGDAFWDRPQTWQPNTANGNAESIPKKAKSEL